MWSPSRSNSSQTPDEAPAASPAPRPHMPAVNSRQYNEGSTYIGKSIVIKGEVSGSEPLHLEGRVEGPISLRDCHLNIGREAVATSDVEAGEVIVRGTLNGNLKVVDRVEVHSGGSLMGNVAAGRVSIECGAFFKGRVDMSHPDPKPRFDESTKSEPKIESELSPVLSSY